jgi:hypothetical protein
MTAPAPRLAVCEEQKRAIREICRASLVERWPDASPERIDAAVDLAMPTVFETGETLAVDKNEVARVGRR